MDVEFMPTLGQVLQGIGLHELKRVTRLRLNVDADRLESRTFVPHRGPTSFTTEV